jgi:hypothetical protein
MSQRLTKHDRIVIDLALQILDEATTKAAHSVVDTQPVRLALRCLLPHVTERWPLVSYWSAASQPDTTIRVAGCRAAMAGIELQLAS